LGLSLKKGTDDIREAASIRVINQLKNKGARIIAYDPMAITNTKKQLSEQIDYAENAHSALKGADCAIVMTEWDEIRRLRAKDFQAYMKTPNLVDARRIYNPEEFSGLNYLSIGRGPSTGTKY